MISTTFLSAILVLVSPVLASCGYGLEFVHPFKRDVNVSIPSYSYGVSTGPLNWHNLDQAYYLCGNGTNQSPILLDNSTTLAPPGSVKLEVPPAKDVELENHGTTVMAIINGTLEAANQTWKLAQFHFHTPSEHRVDLGHYEAEMHFVFAAADGSAKVAVLAFFIEVSAHSSVPAIETILSHLHAVEIPGASTTVPNVDFDSFQHMISSFRYYHYKGSLTTPPCTEGVAWFLATTPIPLKIDTYSKLKNITKTNNRYTQNLPGQQNILEISAAGL